MEADIRYTKAKVEAGGEYVVTQMFFDNQHYFRFVDRCRAAGIEVPIIPGLKILGSRRQLTSLPRNFYCEIPSELADEVEAAPKERALDIGIEWAARQTDELMSRGVPAVHFYVMANSRRVSRVLNKLGRRQNPAQVGA